MFEHLTGAARVRAFLTVFGVTGVFVGIIAFLTLAHWRVFGTVMGMSQNSVLIAVGDLSSKAILVYGGIGLGTILAFIFVGVIAASHQPKKSHGNARLASIAEARREGFVNRLKPPPKTGQDILWGKFGPPKKRKAEFLKTSAIPHGFVAAPTRSGKGVGFVIPNILHFAGSLVVLDVKGENFKTTAKYRRAFGDQVIRIAPTDPERSHCYNPILDIEAKEDLDDQYTEISQLITFIIEDSDRLKTWLHGGKMLFAAAGMLAMQRGNATIGGIRQLLEAATPKVLHEYAAEVIYPQAKQTFLRNANDTNDHLGEYLAILDGQGLGAWAKPYICRVTSRSDFDVRQIRRKPMSIFIDCPEVGLKEYAPLFRLLFQQISTVMHATEPGEDEPYQVLFMLDEFEKLGRMDVIVDAYKTIAGRGGRIVIVTQSVTGLYEIYGRDAVRSFVNVNAGLRLIAATGDTDFLREISDLIGDETYLSKTTSTNHGSGYAMIGQKSQQTREDGRKLFRVDDLATLSGDKFLLLREGRRPIVIDKIRYYEDQYFCNILSDADKKYDALPYPSIPAPKHHFLAPVVSEQEAVEGAVPEKTPEVLAAEIDEVAKSKMAVVGLNMDMAADLSLSEGQFDEESLNPLNLPRAKESETSQ